MEFVVAASFANIQNSYHRPTYFVAVATQRENLPFLESIRTKYSIVGDLSHPELAPNPFDLVEIERELARFEPKIICGKLIEMSEETHDKSNSPLEFVLEGYFRAIESLSGDVLFSSESISECILNHPRDKLGNKIVVEGLSFFWHPLSRYAPLFQREGDFNKLLEYARLRTFLANRRTIRQVRSFITSMVVRNVTLNPGQILDLHWNAPFPEEYADNFVGYPQLIIRMRKEIRRSVIKPGVRLGLYPISRACLGVKLSGGPQRCLGTSSKNPFGAIGWKNELCPRCINATKGSIKPHFKPKKTEMLSYKSISASMSPLSYEIYALYVSIFDNCVKVGRGTATRIVGRMIEQSCADGIAFYPIPGFSLANRLEDTLTENLDKKLNDHKIDGIGSATQTISSKLRVAHIRKEQETNNSDARKGIYGQILDELETSASPQMQYISSLENRKMDFRANWLPPSGEEFSEAKRVKDPRFQWFEGEIMGVAGCIIVVGKQILDMRKLKGYVVDVRNNDSTHTS